MDKISVGRALMGDSLGFHLIIIIFGVGLPVLISALELFGLVAKRPRAVVLARTWTKALVILFIAGAVSGTIISLQFDLIWPKFMAFISKTVGIAFAIEGTMFMVEAVFLSVYALSWDRFKPWWHWLCSLPIVIGSIGSAVFITIANAFMNKPAGFTLDLHGQPVNIHVSQEIFTRTAFTEITHSVAAYICATTLALLAVYAWLYRKPQHEADRPWIGKILVGLSAAVIICGALLAITGDMSARYLATEEPYKLAAAEALQKTQTHAPLIVGGIVSGDSVRYGLRIPSLLSFLATHKFGGLVQGLDKTLPADRPSKAVHYFFDGMVMIDGLIVGVPALFLFLWWRMRKWAYNKWLLLVMVATGFLAILANEFGWLLTELGRQPYIIYGVMRVGDAMTSSQAVLHFGYLFPTFFLVLLTMTTMVLRKQMNHKELHK